MWSTIIIAISLHCLNRHNHVVCRKELRQCIVKKVQTVPQGDKDDFLFECIVERDK